MLARYSLLLSLTGLALYALICAGTARQPQMLVDAAGGGGDPQRFAFWLLAGVAVLTTVSLCRFVLFGIPTMLGSWYQTNKQWIFTVVAGAAICGWFYLM